MTDMQHDHPHTATPLTQPPARARRVTAINHAEEEIELFDNAVGWSWGPAALLVTLSDRRTVCVPLENWQTITIWPV